jgi:hypothetical protein
MLTNLALRPIKSSPNIKTLCRLSAGYYAGQLVRFFRVATGEELTTRIVEVHGRIAELEDDFRIALSALTLIEEVPQGDGTLAPERWVPIENYQGRYLLSDHGQVVSTAYRRTTRERLLKTAKMKDYPLVRLQSGSEQADHGVARLVAAHFLPPPPPGSKIVKHLDGNASNLAYYNLAWFVPPQGVAAEQQ